MTEILSVPFETKSVDDAGTFEGYAAVFGNEDLGGDVIVRGAFTKTIAERPSVPVLWSHDYMTPPIGVSLKMEEDQRGLWVSGRLHLEDETSRAVHAGLKSGALRGLSIGYQAIKPTLEKGVRMLREVKLAEFSPCVFPMNPEAGVTGVKNIVPLVNAIAWAEGEQKIGRVLSAASLARLDEAIEALQSLRAAAAAADPSDEDAEAAAKSVEPGVPTPLASLYIFGRSVLA